MAKPLQDKIQQQKASGGSPNLQELTEKEFRGIVSSIESNQKQILFKWGFAIEQKFASKANNL